MEGLMFLCQNWGEKGCKNEVGGHKYAQELPPGKGPKLWPIGEELKKLDNICKKCKERAMYADEEQCPYCDSKEIERTGGSHDMPGMATAYGYKCLSCKETFWVFGKP